MFNLSSGLRRDLGNLLGQSMLCKNTSQRGKSDGAVGHLIESMLGVKPNKNSVADKDGWEIKSHRENATSMVSLIHYNGYKKISAFEMTRLNGDRSVHLDLVMNRIPYSGEFPFYNGFRLDRDANSLRITHVEYGMMYEWPLENGTIETESLHEVCGAKLRNQIMVEYIWKRCDENSMFVTPTKVHLYSGFDWGYFLNHLDKGNVKVEIDIGRKQGYETKDRSIKFRVSLAHVPSLYRNGEHL